MQLPLTPAFQMALLNWLTLSTMNKFRTFSRRSKSPPSLDPTLMPAQVSQVGRKQPIPSSTSSTTSPTFAEKPSPIPPPVPPRRCPPTKSTLARPAVGGGGLEVPKSSGGGGGGADYI